MCVGIKGGFTPPIKKKTFFKSGLTTYRFSTVLCHLACYKNECALSNK